ncbi:hypothetical protein [Streptomyces sp. T028]|uniref:hypothetical protein n=1 Tax=Streptomyces sp. T028 TaxID=3394379 RepID=UPI003A897261
MTHADRQLPEHSAQLSWRIPRGTNPHHLAGTGDARYRTPTGTPANADQSERTGSGLALSIPLSSTAQ